MISLCWFWLMEDEDDKPKPKPKPKSYVNTDNVIFVVKSQVTSIDIGERRTRITIYGRDRLFGLLVKRE